MNISAFLAHYYTTIWYILVGVLFTGYAVLDGFDLGVGVLYLLISKDEDRRIFLNAIGPVWDGNEVWLVVGGGALFAAFPGAYATVFSGFYMPFILLLAALLFRAVAIEFRSKEPSKAWRQTWDILFALGSTVSAFIIGIALGNITRGIPLDSSGEYVGTLWNLFNPYSILLGCMVVVLFAMHGAIYLVLKTEGALQVTVKSWVTKLISLFILFYCAFNISTFIACPYLIKVIFSRPIIFVVLIADILLLLNVMRLIHTGKEFPSFLCSCLVMALLMMTFGLSYFPNMVYSSPNPENSLTIYNCCSTNYTLGLLTIIVCIGLPVFLTYTTSVYWIFRGKTKLTDTSY